MHTPLIVALLMVPVAVGIWGLVSKRKHLLNMLLSLEYIMLNLFLVLTLSLVSSSSLLFSMYFLTLAVCEGVLGLSLLVTLVRSHGNDLVAALQLY